MEKVVGCGGMLVVAFIVLVIVGSVKDCDDSAAKKERAKSAQISEQAAAESRRAADENRRVLDAKQAAGKKDFNDRVATFSDSYIPKMRGALAELDAQIQSQQSMLDSYTSDLTLAHRAVDGNKTVMQLKSQIAQEQGDRQDLVEKQVNAFLAWEVATKNLNSQTAQRQKEQMVNAAVDETVKVEASLKADQEKAERR